MAMRNEKEKREKQPSDRGKIKVINEMSQSNVIYDS